MILLNSGWKLNEHFWTCFCSASKERIHLSVHLIVSSPTSIFLDHSFSLFLTKRFGCNKPWNWENRTFWENNLILGLWDKNSQNLSEKRILEILERLHQKLLLETTLQEHFMVYYFPVWTKSVLVTTCNHMDPLISIISKAESLFIWKFQLQINIWEKKLI